jgi:hypothetical protein
MPHAATRTIRQFILLILFSYPSAVKNGIIVSLRQARVIAGKAIGYRLAVGANAPGDSRMESKFYR